MKTLDYVAEAAKNVKTAVATAVKAMKAGAAVPASRAAADELRRRAEINARGDALRAEQAAAIFGRGRWLGGRGHGWMNRGR